MRGNISGNKKLVNKRILNRQTILMAITLGNKFSFFVTNMSISVFNYFEDAEFKFEKQNHI